MHGVEKPGDAEVATDRAVADDVVEDRPRSEHEDDAEPERDRTEEEGHAERPAELRCGAEAGREERRERRAGPSSRTRRAPARGSPRARERRRAFRSYSTSAQSASTTNSPTKTSMFSCWQTNRIAIGLRLMPAISSHRTVRAGANRVSIRYRDDHDRALGGDQRHAHRREERHVEARARMVDQPHDDSANGGHLTIVVVTYGFAPSIELACDRHPAVEIVRMRRRAATSR